MDLPRAIDLFAAEVQYWRLDPDCWRPVLEAALEAGLPGISSYVPWEVHEVAPGRFDFEGSTHPARDLVRYLDLVRELVVFERSDDGELGISSPAQLNWNERDELPPPRSAR